MSAAMANNGKEYFFFTKKTNKLVNSKMRTQKLANYYFFFKRIEKVIIPFNKVLLNATIPKRLIRL